MKRTVTVFGDGIGPEITDCVFGIYEAGAELDYEIYNVGEAEWIKNGAIDSGRSICFI